MICKAGHYEPIAREGFVFIIPGIIISFLLWWTGYSWSSFAFLLLSIAIALFFRNPERVPPREDGIVLSPADGRVVEIVENVRSENLPDSPFKRVSIFMSLFDVHVNRWPISGIVVKIKHVPGSFLDARESAASEVNEHNCVVVEGEQGTLQVVQVAGKVARRIACWVEEGDQVKQGDRFGLIRFGSRLDVYLPEGFAVVTRRDDIVKAGLSIIARKA
ncbi:MAG: phosphatidylserine decarboxylase family protein [Desulfomonile tiedjei]|nr:phosphatidylserine decarboxylase family protein [Desulfomonile tiedjei]